MLTEVKALFGSTPCSRPSRPKYMAIMRIIVRIELDS